MHSARSMKNVRPKEDKVRTGTGSRSNIIAEGDLHLVTLEGVPVIIKKVSVVPAFQKQLLSLKLLMAEGFVPHMTDSGGHLEHRNGTKLRLHRESDGMWYIKIRNTEENSLYMHAFGSTQAKKNAWIKPKRTVKPSYSVVRNEYEQLHQVSINRYASLSEYTDEKIKMAKQDQLKVLKSRLRPETGQSRLKKVEEFHHRMNKRKPVIAQKNDNFKDSHGMLENKLESNLEKRGTMTEIELNCQERQKISTIGM
jgi:hypothetical protein